MDEIIFLHYNGLGDYIICNGLVNFLSTLVDKLHLPIPNCYSESLHFLYKDNPKVILFHADVKINDVRLNEYAHKNNLKIVDRCYKYPFNRATAQQDFYHSMNVPYSVRYDYFHLPDNPKAISTYNGLNLKEYIFAHDTYAWQKQKLNIDTTLPIFTPDKIQTNNVFDYLEIIKNATEIHCVDSCFYHLVENMQLNIPKFYHDIRNSPDDKMPCSKDWVKVKYD